MNYFQFTVIQQQTYGLYTKEKRKERHREKKLERKAKLLEMVISMMQNQGQLFFFSETAMFQVAHFSNEHTLKNVPHPKFTSNILY